MPHRCLIAIVFLAGCDSVFGLAEVSSSSSDGCIGRNGADGAGLGTACVKGPVAAWTHPASIDTGPSNDETMLADCTYVTTQSDLAKTLVCVVLADSIAITEPISFTGQRPLILAAQTTLVVNAALGENGVPGENACAPSKPGRSAGGAGGSFATIGGDGGASSYGTGGGHASMVAASAVLAGCAGQMGAGGNGGGGAGGAAGGGLYLIAGESIAIRAAINMSGAGGLGGGPSIGSDAGGGGGGGAGGLIGLDAPSILLEAGVELLALGGGGGGGGASGSSTADGAPGARATPGTAGNYKTSGGLGGTATTLSGRLGGNGAQPGSPATAGASTAQAGPGTGGGGGGLGWIRVYGTVDDRGAVLAPPPD